MLTRPRTLAHRLRERNQANQADAVSFTDEATSATETPSETDPVETTLKSSEQT